jgi:hypothetical protein
MTLPVPRTYAEWSQVLDAFSEGGREAEALAAMAAGRLDWTPGVAQLFTDRVTTLLDLRLKQCSARLQRDLGERADEVTLVRALLDARRHFSVLHQLASLATLPESLRAFLRDELVRITARMQADLEANARTLRCDRTLRAVRYNSLCHYRPAALDAAAPPPLPSASPADVPAVVGRRRTLMI